MNEWQRASLKNGAAQGKQLYVQDLQSQPRYWYYCYNPPGYYPYVQNCKGAWTKVPAASAGQAAQDHGAARSVGETPSQSPLVITPQSTDDVSQSGDDNSTHTSGAYAPNVTGATDDKPPQSPTVAAPPSLDGVRDVNQRARENSAPAVGTSESGAAEAMNSGLSGDMEPANVPGNLSPIAILVIFVAGLGVIWYAAKRFPIQEIPVDVAMRRWRLRWQLAMVAMVVAFVLALLLPTVGIYIFAVGIVCSGVVFVSFGRTKLADAEFSANERFVTAASSISDLKSVVSLGGPELLHISYSKRFEGVAASSPFLVIYSRSRSLIITPRRYWSRVGQLYSTGSTNAISVNPFYHDERTTSPRANDQIARETWAHPTKTGDRDHRYKNNWRVYVVVRYGVELRLEDKSEWNLAGMDRPLRDVVLTTFRSATGYAPNESRGSNSNSGAGKSQQSGSNSSSSARNRNRSAGNGTKQSTRQKSCYEILEISPSATVDTIKAAYHEKVKQYHPDRVASLGPKLRELAEAETKMLNAAYQEALRRGSASAS